MVTRHDDEPPAGVTRSVLVTGASTGIGYATALQLDRRGWRVIAGVRSEADAQRLRDAASPKLATVLLDVTDETQVKDALATVAGLVGDAGLSGLVNNAGVALGGPIEILPLDQWRRQLEVNVVGQIAVTKAALPLLRKATGRVVFVSSISGRVAGPFLGPYAASKHALEAIGMSLRWEVSPWGIRVAMVEPGNIDTPIWQKTPDPAAFEREVGAEAFALYEPFLLAARNAVAERGSPGGPVGPVADAIEHALTAPRPKHRYLVGRDAKVAATLYRYLPDRLYSRAMKLKGRFSR